MYPIKYENNCIIIESKNIVQHVNSLTGLPFTPETAIEWVKNNISDISNVMVSLYNWFKEYKMDIPYNLKKYCLEELRPIKISEIENEYEKEFLTFKFNEKTFPLSISNRVKIIVFVENEKDGNLTLNINGINNGFSKENIKEIYDMLEFFEKKKDDLINQIMETDDIDLVMNLSWGDKSK